MISIQKSSSISVIVFLLMLGATPLCFSAQTLTVPGTGDSQSLLRALAHEFQQMHNNVVIDIPDSVGSSGGTRALIADQTVLARTARPLKNGEIKQGLSQLEFAISPVVFSVHPSVKSVSNLSTQNVLDIYRGKIINWQLLGGADAKIYIIDREKGDSSRKVLEKLLTGFAQLNSIGKTYYDTPSATEAIAAHRNTIGYLPRSIALSAKLPMLTIDGVAATKDNIDAHRYPYVTTFYLVFKNRPSGLARRFIDFIFSAKGKSIIDQSGAFSVDRPN